MVLITGLDLWPENTALMCRIVVAPLWVHKDWNCRLDYLIINATNSESTIILWFSGRRRRSPSPPPTRRRRSPSPAPPPRRRRSPTPPPRRRCCQIGLLENCDSSGLKYFFRVTSLSHSQNTTDYNDSIYVKSPEHKSVDRKWVSVASVGNRHTSFYCVLQILCFHWHRGKIFPQQNDSIIF